LSFSSVPHQYESYAKAAVVPGGIPGGQEVHVAVAVYVPGVIDVMTTSVQPKASSADVIALMLMGIPGGSAAVNVYLFPGWNDVIS
jgi:hypothetical protein